MFSLPPPTDDREIVWHMNHVATPAVKLRDGTDTKEVVSTMPLRVSVALADE